MPNKIFFFKQRFTCVDVDMPCDFCDYVTQSPTAMRLHRKVKHGITQKYSMKKGVKVSCRGCSKEMKNCICQK